MIAGFGLILDHAGKDVSSLFSFRIGNRQDTTVADQAVDGSGLVVYTDI